MHHGSKPKKNKQSPVIQPEKTTTRSSAKYGADVRFIFTRSMPTAWEDEFDPDWSPPIVRTIFN